MDMIIGFANASVVTDRASCTGRVNLFHTLIVLGKKRITTDKFSGF